MWFWNFVSHIERKRHKMIMSLFENRVSKVIFGTKGAEINDELETSLKDEVWNCTVIILMAKEDGQDTYAWEGGKCTRNLVGHPDCRQKDNIKIVLEI